MMRAPVSPLSVTDRAPDRRPARRAWLTLDSVCLDVAGKRLVDGVTLVIEGGAPTLIMGPNGAGKSLLLRLCHGLLEPSSGRIAWPDGQSGARHAQAMVFQRPVMLRRSVAANVDFALRAGGIGPRHVRRQRVAAALEQAGLDQLAARSARVLSGGEQQRLAIARAWALEPKILFLDEPTSNLDPAATLACEAMIRSIGAGGTKIVMTTHDVGQARRLAGDVVFMHGGRLQEQTPAAEFFDSPRSAAAAAFLEGRIYV